MEERLPPYDAGAEQNVVGALMLDTKAVAAMADTLKAEDFYFEDYRLTYEAILVLNAERVPVDTTTVRAKMMELGTLPPARGTFLSQLMMTVTTPANIQHHAAIIKRLAAKRRLIAAGEYATNLGYSSGEMTLDEAVQEAQRRISEVTVEEQGGEFVSIAEALEEYFDKLDKIQANRGQVMGVPTGFYTMDQMTGGFQQSDLIVLAARPGRGKCVHGDTLIVMFDGTRKAARDIQDGELVMGVDSTPRKVMGITSGREDMYRIRQNYGIDYRVNGSHILSLRRSKTESVHKQGDILNINVREALKKGPSFFSRYKGYKVAIDFPEKEFTIDPYFLGVWLGDGDAHQPVITNPDQEVYDAVVAYAGRIGQCVSVSKQQNRCLRYAVIRGEAEKKNNLLEQMREMGLLCNKHIPHDYLTGSTEQRLELLAGILDTDGYYQKDGNCYEITLALESLAREVKYLADTLGFRVSMNHRKTSWTYKGIKKYGEAWRIKISGDIDRIPVRIERKKAQPWKHKASWRSSGIEIIPEGEGEYFGFTLDGDGLFLLEDMTVTHNTSLAMAIALHAARAGKKSAILSLEMPVEQLLQRMLSMETGIDSHRLRMGNIVDNEWEALSRAFGQLAELPMMIDDSSTLTILELQSRVRKLHATRGLDFLVVDYLGLVSGSRRGDNRVQELGQVSRGLKALAKELQIPVLVLAQLSRNIEHRGGTEFKLSDLRDSGEIEQDADLVMFISRNDEEEGAEPSDTDIATISIKKHRNGPTGNVELLFHKNLTKFSNLEQRYTQEVY